MDYDNILKDTLHLYFENQGERLSEQKAYECLRGLLSIPDTEYILETAPKHLLQIIFEHDTFNNKAIFACDVIQLRSILESKKINTPCKVILFSNNVAERVLQQQKCRIVLNLDPQKIAEKAECTVDIFGGMALFNSHIIDIDNLIQSIVVDCKDYNVVATVEKIVKDTNTKCDVYTDSNVPGIDKYKFASSLQKFIVNLPTLGVLKRTVRARTREEALALELARRWDLHPDSKFMQKPDNYKADFWINSPFFDAIVLQENTKKAHDDSSLQKLSDVTSGSTFGTGGRLSGEGSPSAFDNVKKLIYRTPAEASSVRIGDRYRLKKGLAFTDDASIFIVQKIQANKAMLVNKNNKKHIVDIGVELLAKFVKV
jgi:hypothetical protein